MSLTLEIAGKTIFSIALTGQAAQVGDAFVQPTGSSLISVHSPSVSPLCAFPSGPARAS
jgi:hypothetical protein